MKLSVLMSAYNERPWIAQCVARVISQTVQGITSLEIIIVDDASSDGTDRVLENLKKLHPDIIQIIRHQLYMEVWKTNIQKRRRRQ